MKSIRIIAINTFREIIRDRILYGIVLFALLLISLSLVLGELSFAEQARISADFGFAGIQLGAAILSIFVGSSLVAKEIDKQTILTLLAKPITRTQFLLGKFVGLIGVIVAVMFGLTIVLAGVVSFLDLKISSSFFIALYGIVLEAGLLVATAMFFGAFSRPIMTVMFTAAVFLFGHWISSLPFFIEKSKSDSFKFIANIIRYSLPDLEKFNWRSAPIYDTSVSMAEVLWSSLYAFGWTLVIISAAILIFRRRDFV